MAGHVLAAVEDDSLPSAIVRAHQAHGEAETFAVALGDCLFSGHFEWPETFLPGIGVQQSPCPMADNYAVEVEEGKVMSVAEKPLLGLGCYFLNAPALSMISGHRGITRAIGTVPGLVTVPFRGLYVNINKPEDLKRWG
jgi:hypothetical protein